MIMPVSLDPQFEEKVKIIETLAKNNQFQVRLPIPTVDQPEFNLRETIDEFRKASVVVADLSFERPSCYFELGIVETLELDTFIICLPGTYIHQTSHKKDAEFYKDLAGYKQIFENIIEESLLAGA